MQHDEEFWRLPKVMLATGYSRTEIYRQIEAGTFPKQRKYPGTQKSYWLASEVRQWMESVVDGDVPDFEALLE